MNRRFFFRVFLSLSLLAAAAGGAVVGLGMPVIERHLRDGAMRDLKGLAAIIESALEPVLASPGLQSAVRRMSVQSRSRITVIHPSGRVIADSTEDPSAMDNHAARPEVIDALAGHIGVSHRHSDTLNADMIYVALPAGGRPPRAVIRVSSTLNDIHALAAAARDGLARMAAFTLIALLIIAALLARGLSRPLNDLSAAARRLSEGDFSARVSPLPRAHEMRTIAEGFNEMAARLSMLFVEEQARSRALDAVISSLPEGLAVVDGQDRVTRANALFGSFFASPVPVGRYLWQVAQDPELTALIKRARSGASPLHAEIIRGGRNYRAAASTAGTAGEMILTIADITDIRNLEAVKRDFSVNVSHELRTPLTAIRGFVETLQAGADPKNRRFLDIIHRNTERLSALVNDLLTLSELEDRGFALRPEPCNINELARESAALFEPAAAEHKISLRLALADALPPVPADAFRLEQVFVNLIDNAIKYTPEGGTVTIETAPSAAGAIIRVRDTGIGIAPEHQPRLFERFYVVDASRSRERGGTGLGLAIVKHIVSLHGGRVSVESTPGAGSAFTVTLPNHPSGSSLT